MPFVVKFKKVWPRKINADQPKLRYWWSDHYLGWWISLPSSTIVLVNRINSKTFRNFSNLNASGCLQSIWWNLVWNQTRNLTSIREPPRLELEKMSFPSISTSKIPFSWAPVQYHWSSFPSILIEHAPHQEGSFTWNSRWFCFHDFTFHWLECS